MGRRPLQMAFWAGFAGDRTDRTQRRPYVRGRLSAVRGRRRWGRALQGDQL